MPAVNDKFRATNRFTKKKIKEAPLEWWEEYISTRDDQHRNRLIEHYLPIVRYQAERVASRVPASVDFDDLVSSGIEGLMDAMERYNPHHKANFKTFSARRIHGAIIDYLRKNDWVPRLVRNNASKIEEGRQQLQSMLQRNPTDLEMANHLGMELDEYERLVRGGTATQVMSLSDNWQDDKGGKAVQTVDIIPDKSETDPSDRIQRNDIFETFAQFLDEKERFIVMLYYVDNMTMREIGDILDLSESRVCQLHSRLLKRLRARFKDSLEDFIA